MFSSFTAFVSNSVNVISNSLFLNHSNTINNNTNANNIFIFDYHNPYFQVFSELALEHDKQLASLRYELVPLKLNEETFWRVYFYHIELIRLNMNLKSLF